MPGRTRTRWIALGALGVTLSLLAAGNAVAAPAVTPAASIVTAAYPGADAIRPRVLYDPGSEATLQARLTREPYRSVFLQTDQRARGFLANNTVGDPAIVPQRDLSRAAKQLAFEYALDRTVVSGQIVPFPTAADRQAVGDRVRALLVALYERSRMAVPAPLGGFDRDINTSEEIVNYSTAYDTLLGAGYDLGAARAEIVRRLRAVTGELYTNYVMPETAGNAAALNQNNHRTKSGAAVAIAAVALGGDIDAAEGRLWWDWGSAEVDDILRYVMSPGDGGYAEGPFYYRYSMQNVLPFIGVWERFLGASSWTTQGGIVIPAYGRDPVFVRAQQWMIDTTLPDGTMAPIDDANPGRSYYFGTLPQTLPSAVRSAAAWVWPSTPQPLDTDGSVDLGPDTIVAYDDGVVARPPAWAPTSAYPESGVAVLRSGWDRDAMAVVVLGEHDTASEFGRDRTGAGRAPESHEHPDAGSFSVFAYGQRLALDPGYLTFGTHGQVNQPQDHNMVLVDGKGPKDPLLASLSWLSNLAARPPTDGQSTLYGVLDTDGADRASVATRYGTAPITLARNVQTIDDRFVVVLDDVATTDGKAHDLAWQLHGNGGGTSGGTFATQPRGARWTIGAGRLDAAFASTNGTVTFANRIEEHEVPFTQPSTHVALEAKLRAAKARILQVLVPSDATSAPPVITNRSRTGLAAITATTSDGLRLDAALSVAYQPIVDHPAGGPAIETDGWYAATVRNGPVLQSLAVEGATYVRIDGVTLVTTATRGAITLSRRDGALEVHADGAAPTVATAALDFAPHTVAGACAVATNGADLAPQLLPNSRTFTFRPDGNAAPAADAGSDRRAAVGSTVELGGRACDSDGGVAAWNWQLVAAPQGSAWQLTGAQSATPSLLADRAGTYRLRLTVTDDAGATSEPRDVVVAAGPRGADGIDNDLDGLIDSDDSDHDGSDPADAAIVALGPALTATRAGVASADALTVDWNAGDRLSSLPSQVEGSIPLAPGGAVTFDLHRMGATYAGSITVDHPGLGAQPVIVPAAQWAIGRWGGRVLILQATVDGQLVTMLVGDAKRASMVGSAPQ